MRPCRASFINRARSAGHRCDEAIQFAERLLGALRSLHWLMALSHGAVDEQLDLLDQTSHPVEASFAPMSTAHRFRLWYGSRA